MKANEEKLQEGTAVKKPVLKKRKSEELKTDPPLSEKDEVKKSESQMRERSKRF